MKNKLFVLGLFIAGLLAFSNCDDEDHIIPEDTVATTFEKMYPQATRVEWENKTGYQVADFYLGDLKMEAWFDSKGNWFMTETDVRYKDLPESVRKSLEESEYGSWRIEDIDKIEKPDVMPYYVFDLESGKREIDLTIQEDGVIVTK